MVGVVNLFNAIVKHITGSTLGIVTGQKVVIIHRLKVTCQLVAQCVQHAGASVSRLVIVSWLVQEA